MWLRIAPPDPRSASWPSAQLAGVDLVTTICKHQRDVVRRDAKAKCHQAEDYHGRVVPPVLKTRLASKPTIAFPALECLVGSQCLWYLFPFLQNLTDLQLGHLTSGLSNVIGSPASWTFAWDTKSISTATMCLHLAPFRFTW